MLQRPDDLLGVMGIHLAAEGFDVERFAHASSISRCIIGAEVPRDPYA
jgi:hypothetical protein